MTERFYNEMRRHYYTTPSSYLDLIKLYKSMLEVKKKKVSGTRDRIANGLKVFENILCNYINETNEYVLETLRNQ